MIKTKDIIWLLKTSLVCAAMVPGLMLVLAFSCYLYGDKKSAMQWADQAIGFFPVCFLISTVVVFGFIPAKKD